jgi:hypothetical protein
MKIRRRQTIKKRYNKSRRRRGGWNLQNPYNRNPPIPDADAIRIGEYLINHELPRYYLNDDTFYNPNYHYKHPDSPELDTIFKIKNFKKLFTTADDYKLLGMQFYYFVGNPNPIPGPNYNGYSTSDDGVFFFDWITNTPPRNNNGHNLYAPNPLNLPVKVPRPRNVIAEIPAGIVANRVKREREYRKSRKEFHDSYVKQQRQQAIKQNRAAFNAAFPPSRSRSRSRVRSNSMTRSKTRSKSRSNRHSAGF